MNILRLSTLSLALAIAVFALAFANPSSAQGKTCAPDDTRPKCADDTGGGGGDDPSEGGKALLFVIDDALSCDPGVSVAKSFGQVTWAGNVLWDPINIHVHFKLQLKDVNPITEPGYQIFGNNALECAPSDGDFPACEGGVCDVRITVKQNRQGRTSGVLRFDEFHAPNSTTTVWVTVDVGDVDHPMVLRSTPVTVVLPPNEVGCGTNACPE